MAKLKERNPDYDHKAQPIEGFKSGPVIREAICACGRTIRLDCINSDGLHYTHNLEGR